DCRRVASLQLGENSAIPLTRDFIKFECQIIWFPGCELTDFGVTHATSARDECLQYRLVVGSVEASTIFFIRTHSVCQSSPFPASGTTPGRRDATSPQIVFRYVPQHANPLPPPSRGPFRTPTASHTAGLAPETFPACSPSAASP